MKLRLLALSSVATCALLVACSGGDPESTPAGTEGVAPTTTPQPDGTTEPTADSGTLPGEEGGEVITEGGGDPEQESDAGLVADAGANGGTCGPASGDGPAVGSACSFRTVSLAGGAITPGTYDLTKFTVTGSSSFCSSYTAGNYAGRLDVKADGNGGFIFGERAAKSGGIALVQDRSFSATASGSTLTVAQTCGFAVQSTSWQYGVTTTLGKPTLTYRHDVGSGVVRYTWVLRAPPKV